MAWLQLRLTVTSSKAEILSEQLSELGALSVSFNDAADVPIFATQNESLLLWQQTIVTALFNLDANIEQILNAVKPELSPQEFANRQIDFVADKNWLEDYKQHWQPLKFGKNLWVCPSWQKVSDPNAIVIELDPGMAFGTGTHATTALCLEWLEENINSDVSLLIDYGCGSGILTIAALKLGAQQVIAVDNDLQALTATKENVERNKFPTSKIQIMAPEKLSSAKADILIANILAAPLIELANHFLQLLKPNGCIVLSGILQEQAPAVSAAYAPRFHMSAPVIKDGWVRLVGKRD